MGFTRARPGQALTMDTMNNTIETDIKVPDGVGENGSYVWFSPWWVEAAPAAAEGLGGIFSLRNNWPHRPMEFPGTTRGSHLGAIGVGIHTPRDKYRMNQPVSSGQQYNWNIETYDTLSGDGRGGFTAYFDNQPPGLRQVYSKFTRQTQVNTAGGVDLADITLEGAEIVIEGIGLLVPSGVVTVDIETAGRFIADSDSFEPVNTFSWDVDVFEAMDTGTSGILSQAQIFRAEQALLSTVPSVVVQSQFDLDVAMTTQTLEAGIGFRYYKRTPSTNPRAK